MSYEEEEPHWGRRAYDRVPFQVYIDRLIKEIDRRLEILERHDEQIRASDTVTREQFDERHQALQDKLEEKANDKDLKLLDVRVRPLEQFKHDQEVRNDELTRARRDSRQQRLALAALVGGSSSAIVTLILKAFGWA